MTWDLAVKVFPVAAAIGAGSLALLRWIDLRQREIANDEFEKVFRLIMVVTGQHPDGTGARILDQIAAVWMLKEFSRFHGAIRNALDRKWDTSFASNLFIEQVVPEIHKMLQQLPVKAK
ncbi:hypothetical protein [Hyphomonas sp.]|jgi:hypothetical protein|uniref:hypothetical protein n=1 Tax=Hyphomonas sp. TaxID=87 RepID=UPI0032D981C9